jgi:hypothetical protein
MYCTGAHASANCACGTVRGHYKPSTSRVLFVLNASAKQEISRINSPFYKGIALHGHGPASPQRLRDCSEVFNFLLWSSVDACPSFGPSFFSPRRGAPTPLFLETAEVDYIILSIQFFLRQ